MAFAQAACSCKLTIDERRRHALKDASALILGARGSVPVSAPWYSIYGGATTCVLVRLADQYIILDAGTGIMRLPQDALARHNLSLLLTHVHLDHLNGLSMCPFVMQRDHVLDIYASPSDGSEIGDLLRKLYSPPVWPVLPDDLAASLSYHPLADKLEIGGVHITTLDGVHPGGVKLIRLSDGEKSIVFATDCTLTDDFYPVAAEFARDCDLLLCDGQYSADEFRTRTGFGHNAWLTAARFGLDCGARHLRIVHHDPLHTDALLDAAEHEAQCINPTCRFAREGEEISL